MGKIVMSRETVHHLFRFRKWSVLECEQSNAILKISDRSRYGCEQMQRPYLINTSFLVS
jgi:hypothetical protein